VIWFREKKLDEIGRGSKVPPTLLAPLQADFSAVTTCEETDEEHVVWPCG